MLLLLIACDCAMAQGIPLPRPRPESAGPAVAANVPEQPSACRLRLTADHRAGRV
jgi:hypothetical protein